MASVGSKIPSVSVARAALVNKSLSPSEGTLSGVKLTTYSVFSDFCPSSLHYFFGASNSSLVLP